MQPLRLMAVLAHPDDESMGIGGILAKYAAEGVGTYLITATRGQHGWPGNTDADPGPERLGAIREAELRAAAATLKISDVRLLEYMDGELDSSDPAAMTQTLVDHLRRVRPQVVVTFDPTGYYGHPDHIAIAQSATAAVVAAADPAFESPTQSAAHRVSKLYYLAPLASTIALYEAAMGDLVMTVEGGDRRPVAWPDWAVSARIDATDYWQQVWQAVGAHRSQLPAYRPLRELTPAQQRQLWGTQTFYRAMSLVNAGRGVEDDLFAGLRVRQREK